MDDRTFARANAAFGYVFETPPGSTYPPILDRHSIDIDKTVSVDGAGGRLR
jgi:phosphoribosyl 1,2-cyclic phosphate phosphodiesterase